MGSRFIRHQLRTIIAITIVFVVVDVQSFQLSIPPQLHSISTSVLFSSVDEKTTTTRTTTSHEQKEQLPYIVTRGDGSTGGGGIPMKTKTRRDDLEQGSRALLLLDTENEDNVNLVRPKVGAEMPMGRPNWFHVPAPGGKESRYATVKESLSTLSLNTV
jgi:hypothetical protein